MAEPAELSRAEPSWANPSWWIASWPNLAWLGPWFGWSAKLGSHGSPALDSAIFGYSLMIYAAGKYLITRMHLGRVIIWSLRGTSPIHKLLASNKQGICCLERADQQDISLLTGCLCYLVPVMNQDLSSWLIKLSNQKPCLNKKSNNPHL